jgi:hypothetical protein
VLAQDGVKERILDGVLGRIGGRQRHRDHEVGGRKTEQRQDEHLALPAAEQILEHGDGALPGVAAPGHLRIDWQGAEQCDEDKDHRGDRRHRARREQRNARLIAKGRKVVHARQPDDLPPGMGRDRAWGVVIHRLAAREPLPQGRSVPERGLRYLFAKRDARVFPAFGLRARRRCLLGGCLRMLRHLGATLPETVLERPAATILARASHHAQSRRIR